VPSPDTPELGDLEIEFKGLWAETILYETPAMAIVSEAYFLHVDTDWNLDGQEELAFQKGKTMYEAGIALSEFGTRRRRSYDAQHLVMQGLIRAHHDRAESVSGALAGTSNVHFAHKYDLKPIGTIAHEWTMGIGAYRGYERANLDALEMWEQVYPTTVSNELHIALTDTFTSAVFFKDFARNPGLALRWRGVRQDSGDPIAFIHQARSAYEDIGIDHSQKLVVFSDGLKMDRCLQIKKVADQVGFKLAAFGVGTWLTNDFKSSSTGETSKALNIVIKLASINDRPCIKISDDITKNTGDKTSVLFVKQTFGIPVA